MVIDTSANGVTGTAEALLRDLGHRGASGVLEVTHGRGEVSHVWLREGYIYSVNVPGYRPALGIRLLSSGLLSPEQLSNAVYEQRTRFAGYRIGEVLVHLGYVASDVISSFVVEQVHDQLADLLDLPVMGSTFHPGRRIRQDTINPRPVDTLLAVARERRYRWASVLGEIGGPDVVPVLGAQGRGTADTPLGPHDWALLCRVDGRRDLAELSRVCGFTVFETAQVVRDLARVGLIMLPEQAVEEDDTPLATVVPLHPLPAREAATGRESWSFVDGGIGELEPVSATMAASIPMAQRESVHDVGLRVTAPDSSAVPQVLPPASAGPEYPDGEAMSLAVHAAGGTTRAFRTHIDEVIVTRPVEAVRTPTQTQTPAPNQPGPATAPVQPAPTTAPSPFAGPAPAAAPSPTAAPHVDPGPEAPAPNRPGTAAGSAGAPPTAPRSAPRPPAAWAAPSADRQAVAPASDVGQQAATSEPSRLSVHSKSPAETPDGPTGRAEQVAATWPATPIPPAPIQPTPADTRPRRQRRRPNDLDDAPSPSEAPSPATTRLPQPLAIPVEVPENPSTPASGPPAKVPAADSRPKMAPAATPAGRVKPAPVPSATPATARPQPSTPRPAEPTPVAAEPVAVEPAPIPATPGPRPDTAEAIPLIPEAIPAHPEPIPATPEPIPVAAEPIPVAAEPIPLIPEPIPAHPEPIPDVPIGLTAGHIPDNHAPIQARPGAGHVIPEPIPATQAGPTQGSGPSPTTTPAPKPAAAAPPPTPAAPAPTQPSVPAHHPQMQAAPELQPARPAPRSARYSDPDDAITDTSAFMRELTSLSGDEPKEAPKVTRRVVPLTEPQKKKRRLWGR